MNFQKKKDMANFGWFGESEHKVFDYKPIYYDKEKDELKQKFGKVDGSLEKRMRLMSPDLTSEARSAPA